MKVGSCSLQAAWGARRRPREQRRSARGEAGLRATAAGVRGDGAGAAARRAGVVFCEISGVSRVTPRGVTHNCTPLKNIRACSPPLQKPSRAKTVGGRACTPGVCRHEFIAPPGRVACTRRGTTTGRFWYSTSEGFGSVALRRAPLTPRTARAMVLHAHIEARSHPRGSKYGSGLFATCAIAKGAQQELPRFSALLAAGSAPAIIQSPRALVRSSVCTERAPCASWREMTLRARGAAARVSRFGTPN